MAGAPGRGLSADGAGAVSWRPLSRLAPPPMTPHTPARYAPLFLFALALAVSACGGGGGDAPAAAADGATEAAGDDAAAANELFDTSFAQVCRGTGLAQAAEYVPGPGVHPIVFMR